MQFLFFAVVLHIIVCIPPVLSASGDAIHYSGSKTSRSYTGNADGSNPSTTYPTWFAPRGMTYSLPSQSLMISECAKTVVSSAYSYTGCRIREIPTTASGVKTYVGDPLSDACGDVPASDPSNGYAFWFARTNGPTGLFYNPWEYARVYFAD
eukprot:PhF_6_TR15208/c0_g1_i1/m.23848